MKKLIIMLTSLFFLIVSMAGCTASKHYKEYVDAQIAVAKLQAKAPPVLEMSFVDSGGEMVELKIGLPQEPIIVQQVRPNEWAGVVRSGLAYGAMFGGAYVVMDGVKAIASMNQGSPTYNMSTNEGGPNNLNITNNDSNNSTGGGSYQHGDLSETRTETKTEANDNEDTVINQ